MSSKPTNVYATHEALDEAVLEARKQGVSAKKTKRFRVNGAYVMAPTAAKALHLALLAEVDGITCEELGPVQPLLSPEALIAALDQMPEEAKAAVKKHLNKRPTAAPATPASGT